MKHTRKSLHEPTHAIGASGTEEANPLSADLDTKSSLEIARIINREDRRVPESIERALPEIARAIDAIAEAFRRGGRLIYAGAGSSGRLGALDSAECPPTYNAAPTMVQYVIAGGERALGRALEAGEDSPALGRRDMARKRPSKKDVVVGVAASGRTPYTLGALEYARDKGAATICVTANPGSPIIALAHIAIVVEVGPEVVAGSSRMKAGTMQKLVLNMLTTGAFTRLGYVYGNLMVNVGLKNRKLLDRGIGIVARVTGLEREPAISLLQKAGGSVPVALLMAKGRIGPREAERRLKLAGGNLRQALDGVSRKNKASEGT